MATKLKHQQQAGEPAKDNVVALTRCSAEGCGKRADKQNFCNEHYEWFKFGLITKEGKRPSDFDKKFQAFQKHKAA